MKGKTSLFKKWLEKSKRNKLVTFSTVFLISTLIIAGSLGGYFATRSDEATSSNLQTIAPDDFITKKHLDDELAKKLNLADLNNQIKDAHSSLKTDAAFQQHLADALTTKFADYLQKSAFNTELKTAVQSLKTDSTFQTNLAEALTAEFTKYYSKTNIDSNFYTKTAVNTLLNSYLQKTNLTAETKAVITQLKTDSQFQTDIAEALRSTFDNYYTKPEVDSKLAPKADKTYTDTELAKKADKSSVYTKTDLDTKFQEARTVIKKNISNFTLFSDISAIKINTKVYFNFAGTFTPTELETKLFIGTLIVKHAGDEVYLGELFDYSGTKADGFYKLTVRDTFVNGTSQDKVNFIATKMPIVEFQNYYSKTDVDSKLTPKADKTYTDFALALKTDQTYTNTELAKKADKTDLFEPAAVALELKSSLTPRLATKTEVNAKASKTYTDTELAKKADQTYTDTELAKKADKTTSYTKTEVDAKLTPKADKTYTDTELNKKIEYIEVNLDTPIINGKTIGDWTSNELSGLDGLFSTGKVYKIIHNSKTFLVRAANEIKTASEIENTFYGMQLDDSTNKYGIVTIAIAIKNSTSTFKVQSINFEQLKILLNQADFYYDPINKNYLENSLIFKNIDAAQQNVLSRKERSYTTHAALLATQGIQYRLLGPTLAVNGDSKMEIVGAHNVWYKNTIKPKWYTNKFEPNAYYGWDQEAEIGYGESNTLPNAETKKFYKGDIIHFKIHGHTNILGKWAGIKFVLKDKNNTEFATTDAIFSNDYGSRNEIHKFTSQSKTNSSHLMVNLFASKYFEFSGKISFENARIYISAVGWIHQLGHDMNTISTDMALAYPGGFADDGITLAAIEIGEVGTMSTLEITGTAVEWSAGSRIFLRDDISNRQLKIVKKTLINN